MNKYNANMMIMVKNFGESYLDSTDVLAIKRVSVSKSESSFIKATEFSEDLLPPQNTLTKEEQELLDALNRFFPAKTYRKDFRTQKQIDTVYSQEGYRNIEAVWKNSDASDIEQFADWYHKAHDQCLAAIESLGSAMYRFEDPVKTFIAVVAATSQGTLWEENVALAKAVFSSGLEKLKGLKVTENNLQKVEKILLGDFSVVRTEKFGPFFESIINPDSSSDLVVVDSHMIAMWNGLRVGVFNKRYKDLTDTEKAAIVRDVSRIASKNGLSPQSVQAVCWSVWRKMPPNYKAGGFQYLGHDISPEVQLFKDLWPFIYPIKEGKKAAWRYKMPDFVEDSINDKLLSPEEFEQLVHDLGPAIWKHYGIKKDVFENFLKSNEKWRNILYNRSL